ncbi:nucleoside triphosphate pyrophosphohydrolase ham1 [Aspergillus tubingensis]|uniref:Inosine triphosphate pyrophosphatase n=1 Tax=Aspergillus tubingensis TaxID=5068 RepID=A0A9W6EPD1_ASPTU|nr:nucleoside triphosphate pyrophosphohydrolase ham1 [Aspergillus tubingensis]GLA78583.1 nucleoside triphosphate pyrophosphohydrolase ham1 [Aspergillus tubingensis]GLA86879.1 nucleoside triphosphate pyrophosphohydrolase ham1 [Aspergillus tubingensis]
MASMKKINFITGNKNKLAEVKAILGTVIDVENQAVDLPEIQGTIEEIAREKCRRAAEVVGGPVLTEDTALEFHALNGLPGPYIKSFLDALGHEGLNKLLDSFETRAAEAVCTFAFSSGPGSDPILFQGRTELLPGWDPIFEYRGKTYAEMDKEEKNLISHRYKALVKLQDWLADRRD